MGYGSFNSLPLGSWLTLDRCYLEFQHEEITNHIATLETLIFKVDDDNSTPGNRMRPGR